MAVTSLLPPVSDPAPRAAAGTPRLRLAVKPLGTPTGLLDGAWWPRTDDLQQELPALLSALEGSWGRISRITVDPMHWHPLLGRVRIAGHPVTVGWFRPGQDPHKLLLLAANVGRWDLLVVPPVTDEAAAARLMAAATDPRGTSTAGALIAAEGRAAPVPALPPTGPLAEAPLLANAARTRVAHWPAPTGPDSPLIRL
ncbi:DUF5994 family protein [Streptacidiphilus albus]|uniref:DUF5994 family protein n=1 Tax=Streptacidiphilus albus TaxID=105425 RepID=UPI00068C8D02|nr:DUF5994 family protein [Streptacidiphilus albus]